MPAGGRQSGNAISMWDLCQTLWTEILEQLLAFVEHYSDGFVVDNIRVTNHNLMSSWMDTYVVGRHEWDLCEDFNI